MDKLARYIIIACVLALTGFIAWYFREVITYILVAAVLSLIGQPVVTFLSRIRIGKHFHIPKGVAAALVLLLMIALLVGMVCFIVPLVSEIASKVSNIDINQVSTALSKPLDLANEWVRTQFPAVLKSGESLELYIWQYCKQLLNLPSFTNFFGSVASTVVSIGVAVFSIVFIAFYFLKEQNIFRRMVGAFIPDKYNEKMERAMHNAKTLLSRYFVGLLVEILILTVLITCGLCFAARFDFEMALVLGLVFGILNIIPYVGPLFGGAFGVVMGIVAHFSTSGFDHLYVYVLVIVAVYVGSNMLDTYLIQPYIYSNSVKAHPLEIFIVILLSGYMGGAVGMLVAIPSYTVLRVFASEFLGRFKLVRELTGGSGELPKN